MIHLFVIKQDFVFESSVLNCFYFKLLFIQAFISLCSLLSSFSELLLVALKNLDETN